MVRKSQKTKTNTRAGRKTKSSTSGRKTAATQRKKTTRQKSSPKAAPKSRSGSTRASSTRKTTPKKPAPPPIIANLTLDRKLDIAGVIFTLVGLLTLLSLVSSSRSALTESWLTLLQTSFGWGAYALPLGLIGLGLWLILRNFERIPQLVPERVLGIFVLYVNLLAIIHFLNFSPDPPSSYALAAAGKGGGFVGGFFSEMLLAAFGGGGTVVALLAWMLIGVMLTLDVSAAELFRWVGPITKITRWVMNILMSQLRKVAWWVFRSSANTKDPLPEEMAPSSLNGDPSALVSVRTGLSQERPQWVLPNITEILDQGSEVPFSDEFDRTRAQMIEETLASFGAPGQVVEINRGPTITQFGVEPDFIETRSGRMRVRVGKISSLADDLALALAAQRIRIQAPVPGKGYVGIEVPNEQISLVALREVIESPLFKRNSSPLQFALGQDVAGHAVVANLEYMPHLLIAGATGSGKSVCVNAIICCLLLHNKPEDLRLIMIDPKRVELTNYNGIPHLLAPVVVEMERVVGALQWVMREMDSRYQKFADTKTRNIAEFNKKLKEEGHPEKRLPNLVVVIDELADLMMLAPDQTEKAITRLAQLARATGIHLIISTQRPSVDVVTGLIKANLPARVAFAVSSGVDSRVILDQPGAERLLGQGDMLFQAPDAPAPVRLQGVFVSDPEIFRLVLYWRTQSAKVASTPFHSERPPDATPSGIPLRQIPIWEEPEGSQDPLYNEAVDLIRRQGRASISMLQRRLRIGYTRAARLIEMMEDKGIIGPPQGGTQVREVLDYGPAAPPAGEL